MRRLVNYTVPSQMQMWLRGILCVGCRVAKAPYSSQPGVGCPHIGHVLTEMWESDYPIFHWAVWEVLIIPLNSDSFIAMYARVLITHITLLLTFNLCTQMSNLTSWNLYSWAFLHSSNDQNVPQQNLWPNVLTNKIILSFCFPRHKKNKKKYQVYMLSIVKRWTLWNKE